MDCVCEDLKQGGTDPMRAKIRIEHPKTVMVHDYGRSCQLRFDPAELIGCCDHSACPIQHRFRIGDFEMALKRKDR